MKFYFKAFLIFLISASLFGAGFFTAYRIIKKDKEVVDRVEIRKIEIDRFWQKTARSVKGIGGSMLPTLKDGETTIEYQIEPIEGDVITFHCSKPECSVSSKDSLYMTKRLIRIREDGAWWILGDNRAISHDSEDFGWILPSERSDVWVVKLN